MMKLEPLKRPQKGPTEPIPDPPKAHVIPMMNSNPVTQTRGTVWRVIETEFEELGEWLAPRLQEKWPKLSIEGLVSFMRGAMTDRQALFVRTVNTVSVDFFHIDFLEPVGVVHERFCRGRKEASNQEYKDLHVVRRDWAKSVGAREFVYGLDSDAPMLHVTDVLANSRKRNIYAAVFKS